MTAAKEGSVLAGLTAEVMAEKKAAARTLTPVAGEGVPQGIAAQFKTPSPFPNDIPLEQAQQKVGELSRIIDHLTEARDALAAVCEVPVPAAVPDADEEKKEAEKQADFNAAFRAQQAEAQKATFTPADDEWTCPTHGKAVTKVSQKTGREYVGCPECNLFKR